MRNAPRTRFHGITTPARAGNRYVSFIFHLMLRITLHTSGGDPEIRCDWDWKKKDLIDDLTQAGITEINGVDLDSFIKVGEWISVMLDPRVPYVMRKKGSNRIGLVAIQTCIQDEKLCFYDFDRGRMLQGRVLKNLDSGVVFAFSHKPYSEESEILTFTPMTLKEFDTHFRPSIPKELSDVLTDLDDVYIWYRKQAGIS